MQKSEFNPEVKRVIQERVHLREDIPPTRGELVDVAKGNPELEAIQEEMRAW
jgi:hypothetical protein